MGVFGRRLRATRVATGFARADDFARVLGMSPAKYKRIEEGIVEPDLVDLNSISKVTEKSIDWLVTGSEMRGR